MTRKHVYIFFLQVTLVSCDLDLKPSDAKIIRGHGITKTNQRVEYNSSVINISQDEELKIYLLNVLNYWYFITVCFESLLTWNFTEGNKHTG